MIRIHNLHKSFGSQKVLDGVNLDIEDGKTTAIIGPSGTGKSVLLKIIVGLLEADHGSVVIGDQCMTAAKSSAERERICSSMGVLFQAAALFDSMTLFENVLFPLTQRRTLSRKKAGEEAVRRLHEVGLQGFENALPGTVSIGMRKRVGIARALVTNPDVILFDEPNTGLDPESGQEIYDLIKTTQRSSGFTGIVISHEIPEVFQVCDRVAMLYRGKVQAEGPIEEVLHSPNVVVQQFLQGSRVGPIEIG